MDWSAMIPTFLITLREGVEAALVVGIVLAYLSKAGRSELNRWVYWGIAAGLLASVLIGALFNGSLWLLVQSSPIYGQALKQLMEAGFGLVAIGLLSWMLIWMTRQAKQLKGQIEADIGGAIVQDASAAWGIFGIIFLAVLREGFETVVFIAAQFQQGWLPPLGALLGLGGATAIGTLLFKWGVRINLGRFFQVMGVLLLLIVGGLVVGMLAHLDQGIVALGMIDPQWQSLCLTAGSLFAGAGGLGLDHDLARSAVSGNRAENLVGLSRSTLSGRGDRLCGSPDDCRRVVFREFEWWIATAADRGWEISSDQKILTLTR
jgi:high-affinity iron transporter